MDDRRWLLLNQLLEDISDQKFVSEDSIPLVSQLVLELVSEPTLSRTMKCLDPLVDTSKISIRGLA